MGAIGPLVALLSRDESVSADAAAALASLARCRALCDSILTGGALKQMLALLRAVSSRSGGGGGAGGEAAQRAAAAAAGALASLATSGGDDASQSIEAAV